MGNNLLNRTPVAQQLREKNEGWDCIKQKNACTVKETFTRQKRQLIEQEKIFTSYTSDKGLITRIYRELKKTKL
jgi:hypothetical protein